MKLLLMITFECVQLLLILIVTQVVAAHLIVETTYRHVVIKPYILSTYLASHAIKDTGKKVNKC